MPAAGCRGMRSRPRFSLRVLEMEFCNGAGDGVTEAMDVRENMGMGRSGCAMHEFLSACLEN